MELHAYRDVRSHFTEVLEGKCGFVSLESSAGMEFIQPLVPVLHADWPNGILLKNTITVLNIDDNEKCFLISKSAY